MDRYDLYELCVQGVEVLVPFLASLHSDQPRTLAEDFCGTAALSRHWCRSIPDARAVAVDIDPEPLARARLYAPDALTLIEHDLLARALPAGLDPADLVFVGNFSIGEIHDRDDLVAYLRRSRARLAPSGLFVCDLYTGASALRTGHVHRDHRAPDSSRVRYTWQQRSVDLVSGLVTNALHFRVDRGGVITDELHDAFVYRWRLWSIPELRDALAQAGLTNTQVYAKLDAAPGSPPTPISDADLDHDELTVVLIAAWPGDAAPGDSTGHP